MIDKYFEIKRIIGRNPIEMPMLAHHMISEHAMRDMEDVKTVDYLEDAAFTASEFHGMWLDKTCYPDSDITDSMLQEQYGHLCLAVAELAKMLGFNPDDCVRKHVDSLIARRMKDGK